MQSTKLDVSDSFYELLVYENLEAIVQKYMQFQIEQNEGIGSTRTIDSTGEKSSTASSDKKDKE